MLDDNGWEEEVNPGRRVPDLERNLTHLATSPLTPDLGLLSPEGKGRAVRYVPGVAHESTDNRPT